MRQAGHKPGQKGWNIMKNITITITDEEARKIYRACMSRSVEFSIKATKTDDPEMARTERNIRDKYKTLAQNVLEQAKNAE